MGQPVAVGKRLQLERTKGAGGSVAKLTGDVDDSFERAKMLEDAQGITVFDLDGVSRITSYGVREWMTMLRGLPPSAYFCFVKVHPNLVSQFNMVSHFGGAGQLVSLYLPYLCPKCDNAFEVLSDLRESYPQLAAMEVPEHKCPKCQTLAEFDEIPDAYFAHIASAPRPGPPPAAMALIDGNFAPPTRAFRIEKEIADDVTLLWMSGDLDRAAHFKRLADGLEGKVVVVLGRVGQVKETGLTGLSAFLQKPGLDLALARVPLPLARILAQVPAGCGGAAMVSLLLPFRCEEHGEFFQEVAAQALRKIPPQVAPPPCPTCERPGALHTSAEDLDMLRQLPLAPAPPRIAEALRLRPNGPLAQPSPSFDPDSEPGVGKLQGSPNAFGRYELVKRIGLGGMAEVFLARQHGPMGFEKRVVLKRILPQFSSQPAFVEMFLQEARLAARISHPNVVQIFDLGRVGEQYFIAMEYVQGRDLGQIFRLARERGVAMPIDVACRMVIGICSGLNAAHSGTDDHGQAVVIIHRDISPHNVLLAVDGTVKVTDFGIAKMANSGGKTDPGVVKGKINYIAPELFGDAPVADARSDIFAVGIILYQCLTYAQPFFRPTDAGTMRAILQDPIPPLATYRAGLPEELDAIIARAVAKNPSDRYSSTLQMGQALEELLTRLPVTRMPTADWVAGLALGGQDNGEAGPISQVLAFTPSALHADAETADLLLAGDDETGTAKRK